MKLHRPAARSLWPLSCAFVVATMLPRWLSGHMFVDGITYATIARNWAETRPLHFWALHYTDTVHSRFVEQPPLGIWLMSVPFLLWGDVAFCETIYSIVVTALFVVALRSLYRAATPDPVAAPLFCVLVFACPLTGWVLSNNMLEGPLAIFCMTSIVCLLHGSQKKPAIALVYGGFAGVSLLFALLCKGPVALFVLGWPLLTSLRKTHRRRALLYCSLSMAIVVSLCSVMLFMQDDAHRYLAAYAQQQIWQSIRGQREMASWRGLALVRLGGELCGAAACLGVFAILNRLANERRDQHSSRGEPVLWLALALSAIIPIAISPKQSGWYGFAALPVACMAIAQSGQSVLQTSMQLFDRTRTRLAVLSLMLIATTVGVAFSRGKASSCVSDERRLAQYTNTMPHHQIVHVCPKVLLTNWTLHAVLARFDHLSLADAPSSLWHLLDSHSDCKPAIGCRRLRALMPQDRYVLWECPSSTNSYF